MLWTRQSFASGQDIKVGQGIEHSELKEKEIILVQSLDSRLSRQIRQGFQERLAEEEGCSCSFLTYEVKGKVDNIPAIAHLLSRKEADLVLTMGVSAAHTALLASKLKAEMRAQGGNQEAVEARPRTEGEAANIQRGPKRGESESPCGRKGEKAETQPILGDAPTPIVLTGVTDPFYLHILSKNAPLEHVYGVLDPPPLQEQLRLMRLLLPGLERLGVVYSEDAVNMVKVVEDLKEMAEVFGITVFARPVTSLEAVAKAYLELAPEVDAFFLPLDNRLLVQLDLVLALAHQAGLPVFASDTASVEKGALACLGYNYYEAGKMAAEVALGIFKQGIQEEARAPAELPKLIPQKQRLTLNQKTARRLRIVFPASVLRQADSILD